jgi:hypothetical protein
VRFYPITRPLKLRPTPIPPNDDPDDNETSDDDNVDDSDNIDIFIFLWDEIQTVSSARRTDNGVANNAPTSGQAIDDGNRRKEVRI